MSKEDGQANEPENENENEQTEEERAADLDKAVSDAIDEASPTPEKKDETTDDDTDDGTADENNDAEVSPDGGTPADGDEGNTETPEGGPATDADGKPVDGDADPAESGDAATPKDGEDGVKPPEGDEPTEKVDPVNDPIPESTNEKTSERIKSLIGVIKEKETAEVQRDEILDEINATGAQPEQYAATLGFLKLYNSTDATERKQALVVARGLVKELALDLGEGSSVVSLDDHEDLKAEVEAGTLTETRALEVAATRDAKVLEDARDEIARNKQDDTTLTNQNLLAGRQQLDSFEGAMKSADENYVKVRPAFIKLLKPVLKRTHPTEWGAAALELYEQLKTLPIQEQPKPKPKPKNTPLRPKGDAGGGNEPAPEAGSAVDAIDQALANM